MRILKFGGTSLSNSKKFLEVSKIIEKKFKNDNIAIVLSAPAKITNYLEQINKNITFNKNSKNIFQKIETIFYELSNGINKQQNNFPNNNINKYITNTFDDLKNKIKKIKLLNDNSKKLFSEIISKGEIISIKIMQQLLISKNYLTFYIDPIKNIVTNNDYFESDVNISKTKKNIQKIKIPNKHIILMPGFIAGNKNHELVTLGRNGSDYSAAILAVCLNAKVCEIWTDVDGIYTSDPKIIPTAKLLKSISYQEAIELSSFGAKILHPKTILPLFKSNIKCIIKNTYFPEKTGTIIQNIFEEQSTNIKGITYLNNIVNIVIKINIFKNINFIIEKIFSIFLNFDIQILFHVTSYLENKIYFYIIQKYKDQIKNILKKKLQKELIYDIINIINIDQTLKLINIVGNNINNNINVQKKIFLSLKNTNLNIISTNTTFSKNSFIIITNNNNIHENIKIIHNKLFYKINIIEIFLIGIGGVAKALLKQIQKQSQILKNKNIIFKICSISNSKKMLINLDGINLITWKEQFHTTHKKFCIKKIIKYAKNISLFNPVIIDCTASQEIANFYYDILKNNINIVTPNKKANTNTWKEYANIRNIAIKKNKKFFYETNVSAGLPIIKTLKNLFDSGDELISFEGILSGSLSFIFGKLEEGLSISEATIMAKKLGFTEPNPKDDLSGLDVARKLLILARESGYKLELEDIKIIPILPKYMLKIKDKNTFISELSKLNEYFYNKIKLAKKYKKVLRFIGTIKKGGLCKVELTEVDKKNPLYNVKNGENALIIYSKYYQPIPLVLKGYGAGNNVTAAGIFSDLLQLLP
ncbi:bifunctional aspartate kinase/homoserine dehydrogenase I [Buchnera aphidicola]|uniref:Bifunctional aspartokinase/homoserine dehydrogenase n=1 Tax=Buchnera aphidicola (Therioaphis trifolii) TaxID=1241884 RepID=A0A4D6YG36_9GAMM|nr:bifunctional aspartate kinase/homoserine dehydrogenase I [Buchnera aphidicola]QCI27143.1 bifunctional aspartate kinase/homoserine dehydrogenase I [Buchnera aphidicola (Therioaphis trifolii)]